MNYWWVNHKQTYKAEINEGYIWSPKRNNNDSTNQTYLNLTRTQPQDIIFSYGQGKILAVGKVEAPFTDTTRPKEFGATGDQWSASGWMVPIQWFKLAIPFAPKERIDLIAPLLPDKHSPIKKQDGNGNQGVYLAEISPDLGSLLIEFIAEKNPTLKIGLNNIAADISDQEEERKIDQKPLPPTERSQLIKARIGQGIFREGVEKIETGCRVTSATNKLFLIASHIKPWRSSSDFEKLDGNNGFLLSPHVDRLFDKGYISFENNGSIIFANSTILDIFEQWGLDRHKNVGSFKSQQKVYLQYHRDHLFGGFQL